jgi:hypothetical protein
MATNGLFILRHSSVLGELSSVGAIISPTSVSPEAYPGKDTRVCHEFGCVMTCNVMYFLLNIMTPLLPVYHYH